MREFLIFIAFLLLCLLLAALLLPVFDSAISPLAEIRPDRIFYRSAMLIALLGLWPLLGWLQLRNRVALGFGAPRAILGRDLACGWLAGVAILLALLAAEWVAGIRLPRETIDVSRLVRVVATGLIAGLLVAAIEETFFRGVLHSALRRRLSIFATASLTAALYSSLHFVRPPKLDADAEVYWNTGWQLLAAMPQAYTEPFALADSWIALFAVGVFLSLVRERTGSIALAIGLHAGWVAVIKTGKYLTTIQPDAPLAFLVGGYDGIIGWLAAAWISVIAWLYWRMSRRGAGPASTG